MNILDWFLLWQFWLAAALLLLIIEMTLSGLLFIFLPMAIASLALSGLYLPFMDGAGIPQDWWFMLVVFGIISLIASLIIQRLIAKKSNNKDINDY